MDKDKFETQSGGHIKEGHQESDVSVKGIVWSGMILAVGGVLSFPDDRDDQWVLEKWEKDHEAKLTPMEQQLQKERELPKEGLGKAVPTSEGEIKPAPDWYGRGKMEDHLSRTIKTPRLQYDDEHDMQIFRGSEEKWLRFHGQVARWKHPYSGQPRHGNSGAAWIAASERAISAGKRGSAQRCLSFRSSRYRPGKPRDAHSRSKEVKYGSTIRKALVAIAIRSLRFSFSMVSGCAQASTGRFRSQHQAFNS